MSSEQPSPTCGGTAHILPAERAKCSFDVAALQKLVQGHRVSPSARCTARQLLSGVQQDVNAAEQMRLKLFSGAPFDKAEMKDYASYEDKFTQTLERTAAAVKIVRDPANRKFMMQHMGGKMPMGDMFETGALGIHFTMFLTFLKTNASKEQQEVWLPRAQEAKYFGAYAQTELGHGSNVRGLETTATFDQETDEFVIHSPTLSSLKWWPTGMYACTHAVVFAQLVIGGHNHGFHGLMVQLRDENGILMPGVEVGEMGPKINTDNTNIGYARFSHVRVPRFNLFAKYQQVTRQGEYIAPPRALSKFRYISMMQIRMYIVGWSYRDLAKAATIAIRYSCVRKQGFKDTTVANPLEGNIGENCIIEYRMQQYRTFKALGLAYCFFMNSYWISEYLQRMMATIASGSEEEKDTAAAELPELHASLCGLKVWSTLNAHEGIEDCRKACGGQGYLRSSGICDLTTDFAEPATVEGEQVIMSFQVARFLIKTIKEIAQGKPVFGSVEYLKAVPLQEFDLASGELLALNQYGRQAQTESLLALMKDRANRTAKKLSRAFEAATADGLGFDAALNKTAIMAYKSAEHHSMYMFMKNNFESIRDLVPDQVQPVLTRLLDLTMLIQVQQHSGDWIGLLSEEQVDAVSERINQLLDEIRPDCVSLTDGFMFTDNMLKSTLGRFDGNVYEAIYDEARLSPLNQTSTMVGWDHIGQVVDREFLADKRGQRADVSAKL